MLPEAVLQGDSVLSKSTVAFSALEIRVSTMAGGLFDELMQSGQYRSVSCRTESANRRIIEDGSDNRIRPKRPSIV